MSTDAFLAWQDAQAVRRLLKLDATVALPALGITPPDAEIYDGVMFPARTMRVPGLVYDESGGSDG